MFKKTISYTDYNGKQRTEDFTFNLSKAELLEMNLSTEGGMEAFLQKIIAEEDVRKLVELFKDVIIRAYGEKSVDGKYFVKTDENGRRLADKFAQTEAYSELFCELATDDKAAAEFINGIIPQALAEEVSAEIAANTARDNTIDAPKSV